jgi:hypothetical protein
MMDKYVNDQSSSWLSSLKPHTDMAPALRWAGRLQGQKHCAVHATEREQDGEPHRPQKELEVAGVKKLGDGHAKEVAACSCSQR